MTFPVVYFLHATVCKSRSLSTFFFPNPVFVPCGWLDYERVVFKRIIITAENGNDHLYDNKTRVTIVIVVKQTDLFEEKWKKG
jgi:hypothetical protein